MDKTDDSIIYCIMILWLWVTIFILGYYIQENKNTNELLKSRIVELEVKHQTELKSEKDVEFKQEVKKEILQYLYQMQMQGR